jgi:hypothetical protein
MKRTFLLSFLVIFVAGCSSSSVATANNAATTASGTQPAATQSPVISSPIDAATPTVEPSATPASSATSSQAASFSNLLPATLEGCIQDNILRGDTSENFQADMSSLLAKELAAMQPDPGFYPDYVVSVVTRATSTRLNMARLVFQSVRMSSCSYVDFGAGKQFLVVGFYLDSYWDVTWNTVEYKYTEPVHFAFDLNLQKNLPASLFIPSEIARMDLFANGEQFYQYLLHQNVAGHVSLNGVWPSVLRALSADSIDANLNWLYNYEYALSDHFWMADQVLFTHSPEGIPAEDLTIVHEWASHYLFPVEYIRTEG